MANLIREHRIVDTNRRALIKYVCVSDGTQLANSTLIDVSTLAYALNANGYIMSSNTHPLSTYRTAISRIKGATNIGPGSTGYLKLQWQGDSNSEIIVVSNDSFDYSGEAWGGVGGGTFPNPEANSSGDILISTVGMKANDNFTLFIEVRKDARDYDQGQTADPTAFNRGPAAL
jgi:hypothetical protein